MWADIYNISYLLLVNGHHLWFSKYSDVKQYSHLSLRVIWLRKHSCSHWNLICEWFTTHPDIGQYPHLFFRVFWHWKHGITAEIVLLSCMLATLSTLFQLPFVFLTACLIWKCYLWHNWKVWPQNPGDTLQTKPLFFGYCSYNVNHMLNHVVDMVATPRW